MTQFEYACEAELFPARGKRGKANAVGYRRFASAAEALRFAMEEMPAAQLLGAFLEVAERRYGRDEMRRLYESPDYPLRRLAAA